MSRSIDIGSIVIALLVALAASPALADKRDDLVEQASRAYAEGDLTQALALLKAAAAEAPGDLEVHLNLGIVAVQAGALPDAEAAFVAAVGIAPTSYDARFNLGKIQVLSGRLEQGVATLTEAAGLADPGDDSARVEIAAAWLAAGKLKKAEKALDGLTSAASHALRTWLALSRGRFAEAVTHAEAAVAADSGVSHRVTHALALLHAGQREAAVKALKELVRVAPATQANVPYGLALAAFLDGDLTAARRWLGEAESRAPGRFDPESPAFDALAFPTAADLAFLRWSRAPTGPEAAASIAGVTVEGAATCQVGVVVAAVAPALASASRCPLPAEIQGVLTADGLRFAGDACLKAALDEIRAPELSRRARCKTRLTINPAK